MAKRLTFDGTRRNMPVQDLSVGDRNVFLNSPRIEIEDMGTLGVPVLPYKYLPVQRITTEYVSGDRAYEKPVVIPNGKVVSMLTNMTILDSGDGDMTAPTASGTLPMYEHAVSGSIISGYIDTEYYGYDEDIYALIVPCNGGVDTLNAAVASADYSTLTLPAQTTVPWLPTTATLAIAATNPAGVVYNEVYADLRGSALTYELQDAVGVAHKGFITVPYVQIDQLDDNGSLVYAALSAKYQYLPIADTAAGKPGTLIQSDNFGNFVLQRTTPTVFTQSTVGKLISTDSRFPKELSEEIRAYPYGNPNIPNVRTAGVPADLYYFVQEALKADSKAYAKDDVKAAIRSGAFGYARIQLCL